MKKRFTDEQIIGLLKQTAAGALIEGLCRKHGEPTCQAGSSAVLDMAYHEDLGRLFTGFSGNFDAKLIAKKTLKIMLV